MAGKSAKKIYSNNYKFVKNLRLVYFGVLVATLLLRYSYVMLYVLNVVPAVLLVRFINVESLSESLIDLTQPESFKHTVYEYMVDFIYLSVLGNMGYLFFKNSGLWVLVITGGLIFLGYKLMLLKEQYFPSKHKQGREQREEGKDNGSNSGEENVSKRQKKLQKRQQKYQYR